MNLGMRAHDLQAETIEQLSRKCQLNDIHSIQLALAKTVKDFKYGQFSPAYARKIKKELEHSRSSSFSFLPNYRTFPYSRNLIDLFVAHSKREKGKSVLN